VPGRSDFDALDWVLATLSSEHFDQREAGQLDQRIEKLSGLVPGLDAGRLWSWCQAWAVIVVVQRLHHRPADQIIRFLLNLAR
jgi:hypothetical protein